MKTITREQLFELLDTKAKEGADVAEIIKDLETKDFTEVEVIPPQHKGDGWKFLPILIKE